MKTRFLLLTFWLLGFVSLQAQDGEIIYSDSINVCDFYRNGYPSEGTHFDIDGDSIYDFHTTAGITAINEATFLGIKANKVGWAVYPCFHYDIMNDPSHPGYITWFFSYLPEGIRIDTLQNIPDGISKWDSRMYQAVFGGTAIEPDITEDHLMIAIRHEITGADQETHYCYGWMECSMNWHWTTAPPQWTEGLLCINRMAFCTIPDYPLCLGQTNFTWDVEEIETTAFATLHPNPTTGQVTIMGQDLKAAVVFNTLGQQVATASGEGETLHIDIAKLPAGVYFVNVTDNDGRKCVRKVVKE